MDIVTIAVGLYKRLDEVERLQDEDRDTLAQMVESLEPEQRKAYNKATMDWDQERDGWPLEIE